MSYLTRLTLRLAAGAMRFDEDLRQRHASYLASLQQSDGGFPGREGPSDLYYTGFALRGLTLLGTLDETDAERAAGFLQASIACPPSTVDYLSLVSSAVLLETLFGIDVFARAGIDRATHLREQVAPLARPDGGFAKTPSSKESSTYQTFLVLATEQLIGLPAEERRDAAAMIRSRQREDGGFVELGRLRQSGTNPTAAAIGVLRLLDGLDEPARNAAAAFLASMQGFEGGLRAHGNIPIADLLSTFTGMVALADLDAMGSVDLEAARRYVLTRELPGGGFSAGLWDQQADAEYTFYGIGTLALLLGESGDATADSLS